MRVGQNVLARVRVWVGMQVQLLVLMQLLLNFAGAGAFAGADAIQVAGGGAIVLLAVSPVSYLQCAAHLCGRRCALPWHM
jgi:hypothetical protein